MSRQDKIAIILSNEEVDLIHKTTYDTDLEGTVRRLLDGAMPVISGGQRIRGTVEEIDDLLAAIWVEIRGYQRLDEERLGRELSRPRPGTTAGRLALIYDKIEEYLS